jgi:hypothetical protein
MPNSATAEEVSVQLRLKNPPSVRMITSTRHFIEELCEPLVGTDIGSQIAMVVNELMENLTKYAEGGSMRLEVQILPHQDHYQIRITAANRASPAQLGTLEQILKDIAKSEDPRLMYLRYMNQSVLRKEGSGLGLSRIRAEGDMNISYSREGDEITIRAEATIPGRNQ